LTSSREHDNTKFVSPVMRSRRREATTRDFAAITGESPMADEPRETAVIKFRKGVHARPMPKSDAEVVELPLPEPERLSPTGLLSVLARDAEEFERALVVMTKTERCPCGCGQFQEVFEVFTAGDVPNERVNWIADKLKLHAMGFEVGVED